MVSKICSILIRTRMYMNSFQDHKNLIQGQASPSIAKYCQTLPSIAEPSLEQVPRVPGHLLRFGNGCLVPDLISMQHYQTVKKCSKTVKKAPQLKN